MAKMDFLELVNERYAVKKFTGEKIPEEIFEKIKEAIRFSPSSANLQPWKIKIVEDKETLMELQEAAWNQVQVGSASHLLVFCATDKITENLEKVVSLMKEKGVPEEKVNGYKEMVMGMLSQMDEESRYKFSESAVFAALENALLSSFAYGYGSCPMGGFDHEKFKEILNLPEDLKPVVICPIGVPDDEKPNGKIRLSEEDIFF